LFPPLEIIFILLIGAGAGVITGVMGGSGVVVVVPALTLLDFPVHTAIGTSLLIDIIATLVTSYVYHRHGNVYLRPGLWIALGSVAGAQAGSFLADLIPPLGLSNLFGVFLIPMGVMLWIRGVHARAPIGASPTSSTASAGTWRSRLAAIGLGIFVGFMCGIFGAGGGVMILLILIFVLHYPIHLAVGTSSLIMAITATSGVLGYGLRGHLDIFAALIASVTTVLTAGTGARVAYRVSERTLGHIIGTIFILLGIGMIVSGYWLKK
jgi:hypothetical protein